MPELAPYLDHAVGALPRRPRRRPCPPGGCAAGTGGRWGVRTGADHRAAWDRQDRTGQE